MKLYRIEWQDDEPTAQTTDWASSQREANRIAADAGETSRVRLIDVPTDKAGLLAWLRKEIWCDAGAAIAKAERR